MSDTTVTPEQQLRECQANPVVYSSTMATTWFIDPPAPDKYKMRSGNDIKLLNCGEAYLRELRDAINDATDSIYIAIWGFDDELSLVLLKPGDEAKPENYISKILEDKAAGKDGKKPVEVKILVYYNWIAENLEPTFDETAWLDLFSQKTWSQRARDGEFPNLQFMTRDYTASYVKMGWLKFATHHQKCILIDHRISEKANGFVQGFNFKPEYFDFADHPYRENEKPNWQDVGLHLRGPCLIDLFHNFQEGWNKALNDPLDHQSLLAKALDRNKSLNDQIVGMDKKIIDSIVEAPPIINPITDIRTYNAQILRTWMLNGETSICNFITNAIPRINEFIYIEDQYFRYPHFADQLMNRGSDIRKKCGNQKSLYVFVVLSPNKVAVGEPDNRLIMVDFLGRNDVDADKEDFNERQSEKIHQKIIDDMNKNGVMVHICQLLASGKTKNWINQEVIDYKNIYVHAKLSIYDDAYLLLGSANWNQRSMKQDSELDIAVQYHDGQCDDGRGRQFREELWSAHLRQNWDSNNNKGKLTEPKEWYKQWDELLQKNWKLFIKKEPLIMNLFPYYENLKVLRWKSIKQWFD